MALSIDLAELRSRSQELADMVDSDYVSDNSWLIWINSGYAELYDLLVASDPERYSSFIDITLTSSRDDFGLSITSTVTVAPTTNGRATFTITAGTGSFAECRQGDTLIVAGGFNAANIGSWSVVSGTSTVVTVMNKDAVAETDVAIAAAADISATAGPAYSLPSDFYKLLRVDLLNSPSEYITLHKFNLMEEQAHQSSAGYGYRYADFSYRMRGDEIIFAPGQSTGTIRLYYIPAITKLSADTDTINGVNGWEDYICYSAAIKALAKEESDPSVLMAERDALRERIETMSVDRDAGTAENVLFGGRY